MRRRGKEARDSLLPTTLGTHTGSPSVGSPLVSVAVPKFGDGRHAIALPSAPPLDPAAKRLDAFKDRTSELKALEEHLRTKGMKLRAHKPSAKSAFQLVAEEIVKDLQITHARLGLMAKLARNSSLFNEAQTVAEIEELRAVITADLKNCEQKIALLYNGSAAANTKIRNKQADAHLQQVANLLKQKLTTEAKHFQSILEKRTQTIKEQQEIRKQFEVYTSPRSPARRTLSAAFHSSGNSDVSLSLPAGGGVGGVAALQMDDSVDRLEAVQKIERTMVELQGIFRHLATLVAVQREKVERIDANIDMSHTHIEDAQSELLKFYHSIGNNRKMVLQLFGVLVVVIFVFVKFYA